MDEYGTGQNFTFAIIQGISVNLLSRIAASKERIKIFFKVKFI